VSENIHDSDLSEAQFYSACFGKLKNRSSNWSDSQTGTVMPLHNFVEIRDLEFVGYVNRIPLES